VVVVTVVVVVVGVLHMFKEDYKRAVEVLSPRRIPSH